MLVVRYSAILPNLVAHVHLPRDNKAARPKRLRAHLRVASQATSDGLQPNSIRNLIEVASNLVAMASNLIVIASSLL